MYEQNSTSTHLDKFDNRNHLAGELWLIVTRPSALTLAVTYGEQNRGHTCMISFRNVRNVKNTIEI